MSSQINLIIDSIQLYMLEFSISPTYEELDKSNVIIQLNNNEFNSFNIYDVGEERGKRFRLVPNDNFGKYDFLSIRLDSGENTSNKVKIYFCKYFGNKADLGFELPDKTKGEYKIIIKDVNGYSFNVASETIVVSYPIDVYASSAKLEGGDVFHVDEEIDIKVQLKDNNQEFVPNGNYLIEIEAVPY